MNPDAPSPLRSHRGFTLVEVTVAAAVGTVLLLSVFAVVRGGGDIHRHAWQAADSEAEARAALQFLVAEWRSRVPGAPVDFHRSGGAWRGDRLGFFRAMTVAERAADPDGGDVMFVSYELRSVAEGGGISRHLVRSSWGSAEAFEAWKAGGIPSGEGVEESVAFRVAGFEVELFERANESRLVPVAEGEALVPEAAQVRLAVVGDPTAARLVTEDDWERLPREAARVCETRLDFGKR